MYKDIGVGTVGAVGAAAPPILGQGVQTMHYAPPIFLDENLLSDLSATVYVYLIVITFFQT